MQHISPRKIPNTAWGSVFHLLQHMLVEYFGWSSHGYLYFSSLCSQLTHRSLLMNLSCACALAVTLVKQLWTVNAIILSWNVLSLFLRSKNLMIIKWRNNEFEVGDPLVSLKWQWGLWECGLDIYSGFKLLLAQKIYDLKRLSSNNIWESYPYDNW